MARCYVALGANLGRPELQLSRAIAALGQLPQTDLVNRSQLYRSPPMAGMEQPDYLNAVACIDTDLAPLALLDALQQIERDNGRERHQHWGARTLDLDLLLYGDQQLELPRLTVPHYGMAERAFVLLPLFEIAPALILPNGQHLASLMAQCPPQAIYLYRS
ncbi:2-amino-4-hydroxy-6-hydroxymethyldihydropteridine diphosphokinase [uncultured Ferrimonas sp.]|uniref:2-amino-4-hydroxy-6- hydroxymethyldihydropteridine diphosphokinase n=1 Tax=uncultured Ferrimonas sp. TaxID=432640 RepID=UPI00262A8D8A|nr:2-amino-4-hydroxy-6-hydroxymethyldihydropteridine diphosphokinase [uncultured Ferrimonas sp.]